jgi:hypothetical protein
MGETHGRALIKLSHYPAEQRVDAELIRGQYSQGERAAGTPSLTDALIFSAPDMNAVWRGFLSTGYVRWRASRGGNCLNLGQKLVLSGGCIGETHTSLSVSQLDRDFEALR